MSFVTILFRKALSGILFIVNIFKRLIGLFWRRKENNIGELPFIAPTAVISQGGYQPHGGGHDVPHHNSLNPQYSQQQNNSWNSWNDSTFGMESKIEEYRRKQSEALQRQKSKEKDTTVVAEPDYFNDLRPEIKATKRVQIDKERATTPIPRKNLFEFNENEVDVPMQSNHELGDLDFDSTDNGGNNAGGNSAWDDDINIDEMDQVLKAQKQQERVDKQKQRLLEHERRQHEKKKHHH